MTGGRRARSVGVNGKGFTYTDRVCFETLSDAGWVFITAIGEENLYFNFKTDSGEELAGYCKCL